MDATVSLADLQAAFNQTNWLFRYAWACQNPYALEEEANRLSGVTSSVLRRDISWRSGRSPGEPSLFVGPRFDSALREAPQPLVRQLSLESPMESTLVVPGAMTVAISAMAALMFLIEEAWTLKLRIEARESELEAKKSEFLAKRAEAELKALEFQAEILRRGTPETFQPMDAEIFDLGDDGALE